MVFDPKVRLMHARGQSFGDLAAFRFGKVPLIPDGVAFPRTEADIEELLQWAGGIEAQVVPYGGGTSVTGGVTPIDNGRPVITISLEGMSSLIELDEKSHMACFEAGVQGPWLEAQLRAKGFTLGHFPQSFAYSSLGGWIVTHSSGQESLGYGRIADMFQGGRLIAPKGSLEVLPHPASAAGPELKHLVLGSEGCLGILTEATVKVRPLPKKQLFLGAMLPGFKEGVRMVQAISQARLPLCMLRLSDEPETRVSLVLANLGRLRGLAEGVLRFLMPKGQGQCLLLYGAAGEPKEIAAPLNEAARVIRSHKGLPLGRIPGISWQKNRFKLPYLRNTLWDLGYGVDTLETATSYSRLLPTYRAVMKAFLGSLAKENERVYAMAHLSHTYETGASLYFTFFFRLAKTLEDSLDRWLKIKHSALRAIVDQRATLSHHHGVGLDHLPFLGQEKGPTGLLLLRALKGALDPQGLLNPGKLIPS
jgi:alkyldihydroxyacetonephosphate synthase